MIRLKTEEYVSNLQISFPMKPDGTAISLLLLALRLLFGGLLLSHGMQKWTNFDSMSASFPDPLGVGHSISLGLAIFGGACLFHRFYIRGPLSACDDPHDFYHGNGFFVIHGNDPFSLKELAFIYLVVFILMYITGPGKFSLDRLIAVPLSRKQK